MTTPDTLDPVAYERRGFYHTLQGKLEGLGVYDKTYIADEIRRMENTEANSEDPQSYREAIKRFFSGMLDLDNEG